VIRIAQPDIGEEEQRAVAEVLASGQLAGGPAVRSLEEAFARDVAHTREAVAAVNGTAALHLALLAHDIGPGDEVITTPFTFQATANMVLAVGARPVFVDIGEAGNIDPERVEAAVTPRTRCLLPVHIFGRLCDMAALSEIADRHSLVMIEDAAQAHGAEVAGKRAGSFGTGCFSFYATKNMTTGEGGMLTTDDSELAARLRRLRSHGESERYNSIELGFNYRLTDIAAAIGLVQLRRLDGFTERRRRNAEYLSAHLRGVICPPEPVEGSAHVWHQYAVRVPSGRDDLASWLEQHGIATAVHYPRPLPTHPLYRSLGYSDADLPNARRIAGEVLSLPVHHLLSGDDLQRIVAAVNEWTEGRVQPDAIALEAP
jgi:dTDP-4-amino-4,6-dideoxygalactose transaminase